MAAAAAARALGYTICYKKSRDYVITTSTYVLSLIDENRKNVFYVRKSSNFPAQESFRRETNKESQ